VNRASKRAVSAGHSAVGAIGVLLLGACGSTIPVNGSSSTGGLHVDLQDNPIALFDPTTGKTTVVVDFLVRDAAGNPVDPNTTSLRRYVNGQVADVESVANFQDTKLSSSLRLGMVLDASYSMTTWQPPAFEPMKQAAYTTLQSIRTQFASWNTGTFTPYVSWFQDQYICNASAAMPDSGVLDIRAPTQGDSTKLFAAAAEMADQMKQIYNATPTWSPADHFAMMVFTDGYDNYSWFDTTASATPTTLTGPNGGSFSCSGAPAFGQSESDGLSQLVSKLQAFPQLKVYVIGLGNQIKASELSAIATAGHGRFVSNPDSSQVSSLFAEITREFTTLRRDGIIMPLPPGDYSYTEEVTVGSSSARVNFKFHAGDANASVMTSSIASP
jgi:hypothetical protein